MPGLLAYDTKTGRKKPGCWAQMDKGHNLYKNLGGAWLLNEGGGLFWRDLTTSGTLLTGAGTSFESAGWGAGNFGRHCFFGDGNAPEGIVP